LSWYIAKALLKRGKAGDVEGGKSVLEWPLGGRRNWSRCSDIVGGCQEAAALAALVIFHSCHIWRDLALSLFDFSPHKHLLLFCHIYRIDVLCVLWVGGSLFTRSEASVWLASILHPKQNVSFQF
jgi:hypothetical protein